MISRLKRIILIIIAAGCAVVGGILLYIELDARQVPTLVLAGEQATEPMQEQETIIPIPPTIQVEIISPLDEDRDQTGISNHDTSIWPNTLIIHKKVFSLKGNVSEETLKKNIGWMESSARPGEIGVCVIMGHRNGQFRILKDVKYGDIVTIVDAYGIHHAYTVIEGQIITSGAITYEPTNEKTLVLVTCYPFYYSGHAPYQYMVKAIGIS